MQGSNSIETTVKGAGQNPAKNQDEVRSIDWLSRSPDPLVKVERPAPSDQQLMAIQAAVIRLLARLTRSWCDVLRSAVSPRTLLH
jgi:hypothetical protein